MVKNLVIVESPAKGKTIEGFLGADYTVKSCFGHIRDLAHGDLSVDVENNFAPVYEIPAEKKKIVDELKKIAKQSDTVWLATDEDREGEAISWHLSEALKLNEKKTKRIVFHEITKKAITEAVANPRSINYNLVNAQQARRVLDRLVGFEISPILWRKISMKSPLSAGRVQSVAVRLIVEREREIDAFNSVSNYKVVAYFNATTESGVPVTFKAELPQRLSNKEDAQTLLEKLKGAEFFVKAIEKKPSRRSPSAPFTTSTLQQEASRKLGFSVSKTMLLAQRLYESGKITYMRTDSVNLSETAVSAATEEITSTFGSRYVHTRQYKTKTAGAQEAHEAIRPAYLDKRSADSADDNENRLYDLIWKRTIASQMADADIEKTIVNIANTKTPDELIASGEVILFDGYLKVYMESSDDEDSEQNEIKERLLPAFSRDQKLNLSEISATEKFSQAPPRYTEASLVKKLEALGIGRPSTYAPTISTIQKRGYVVKENRPGKERIYHTATLKDEEILHKELSEITGVEKAKLFPTDVGCVVNDFLVHNFQNILDYNFTAKVEEEFDEIAAGQKVWTEMIKLFYGPFHKNVETTSKTSERATGERLLGNDPASGLPVYVKIARYGPVVQMGATEEKEKPRFASLRKDQRIDTITLEQALDLFRLPRVAGSYEDEDVVIAIGRFGPYVKHKNLFYSLKKDDDPYSLSLERAIEVIKTPKLPRTIGKLGEDDVIIGMGRFGPYVKHKGSFYSIKNDHDPFTIELPDAIKIIEDKAKAAQENVIKTFETNTDVKILKGRWGPYIVVGKKNVKIPQGKTPESLTIEECLELAKNTKTTKRRFPKK